MTWRDAVDVDAARRDVGRDQHARAAGLERVERRWRAPCDLLPWMASARTPRASSCSARRFAPCLVRVNTSTRFIVGSRSTSLSSARLSARSTSSTHCATRLDGARRPGATATSHGVDQDACRPACGSRRASSPRTSGSAAARQRRDDAADVVDEAHVQHAIGLVEHEHLDGLEAARDPAPSGRAGGPGVATRMSTSRRSASTCGPWPTPPKITAHVGGEVAAVGREALGDLQRRARAWARAPARAGRGARASRRARQAIEDGQRERGRLAGAGLRAAEQVAPGKKRDGLRLDGRRAG